MQRLIALRRENPALRPQRFGKLGEHTPSASVMEWYDQNGETMSIERWTDPSHRTLQYVAASTPENEAFNRILLIVHGNERPVEVTLPAIEGVTRFVSLWSSEDEAPSDEHVEYLPGDVVPLAGTSMRLFRVRIATRSGAPETVLPAGGAVGSKGGHDDAHRAHQPLA